MRNAIIVGIAFASFSIPATADWQSVYQWCVGETNRPTQARCIAREMPDGNLRGMRSAATLIVEARNAKKRGDTNAAFNWVIECVCHDLNAQNELRANRAAVLNALK